MFLIIILIIIVIYIINFTVIFRGDYKNISKLILTPSFSICESENHFCQGQFSIVTFSSLLLVILIAIFFLIIKF